MKTEKEMDRQMMIDSIKMIPIETEYDGVVFRSKSEAIFARALELRGYIWEYEPEKFMVDGWTPDFWAIALIRGNHRFCSALIEYKPSQPTDSYLKQLANRFHAFGERGEPHIKVIAWGNSFNEARGVMKLIGNEWEEVESRAQLFFHIQEASRFRFDLKTYNNADIPKRESKPRKRAADRQTNDD